nr:MAG TPA: hypothetical protein [Caudoviricetes sp.]
MYTVNISHHITSLQKYYLIVNNCEFSTGLGYFRPLLAYFLTVISYGY